MNQSQPRTKYDHLLERAKQVKPAATIDVHPCDETSLRGVVEAAELGIIQPTLVGPTKKITDVARTHNLQISGFPIVDAPHGEAAAAKAVELIHESKGEML